MLAGISSGFADAPGRSHGAVTLRIYAEGFESVDQQCDVALLSLPISCH